MGEMLNSVASNVMSDHNRITKCRVHIPSVSVCDAVKGLMGEILTSVASNVMSDHNHSFSADDEIDETVTYVTGKA